MNVTFTLSNEEHKESFDKLWTEAGISGLKGHRSIGGYRASIYNAMPEAGIEALVSFMAEFERNSA